MNRPDIAYTLHCSCGFTGSKSLVDHASSAHDGFYHTVTGWTVCCLACGRSAHQTPVAKSLCENWARQHRSLGCGA